jgi:hypothetical protein
MTMRRLRGVAETFRTFCSAGAYFSFLRAWWHVMRRESERITARMAEQHRPRSKVIPHLGPPVIKASDTLIVRSHACFQAQVERRVASPSPCLTTKSP